MHLMFARHKSATWVVGPAVFDTDIDASLRTMDVTYMWENKVSEAARAEIGSLEAFQQHWNQTDLVQPSSTLNGWECYAYPPSGGEEKWEGIEDWNQYTPLRGITKVLNRLAQEGWCVITGNEDKALSGRNESVPRRLR
jgi:hypothetical protein